MEKYFEIMEACPLFFGVSREDRASLLGCLQGKVKTFSKGEPVFLEGDAAGFVGLILTGAVQIVLDDYQGNRSVMGVVTPGELFGETYACSGIETMPVSGYAVKDTEILLLSCRKMLTVCSNACRFHNQLVKNLLQIVAESNLNLSGKIRIMSQKTTREKLMVYLLEQAKKNGSDEFTIPFDRQGLADYLGVERSAMSAELGKLRRDGFLTTNGSHFCIKS